MDASLLQDFLDRNQPFEIETAAGRTFRVPHRDVVSFSPKKTAITLWFEQDGAEHIAVIPLLTVTSILARTDA